MGFVFFALSAFFGFFYVFIQFALMVASSEMGYDTVIVGYECIDILNVTDTLGQTCAWYDIGTNSDNCGAYDRIFQARTYDNYPTGTAVWNSATNSYDYVQNNVVAEVPAFTAATTCCSCGKPDTPITE